MIVSFKFILISFESHVASLGRKVKYRCESLNNGTYIDSILYIHTLLKAELNKLMVVPVDQYLRILSYSEILCFTVCGVEALLWWVLTIFFWADHSIGSWSRRHRDKGVIHIIVCHNRELWTEDWSRKHVVFQSSATLILQGRKTKSGRYPVFWSM
jgi:hypothetical protein